MIQRTDFDVDGLVFRVMVTNAEMARLRYGGQPVLDIFLARVKEKLIDALEEVGK